MINSDVYLFMWRMLQFNIFSKERLKKSPSFFGRYESRRKTIIGYILRFIVKASEQSGVRCIFCKPLQSSILSNIYNYSSRRCHNEFFIQSDCELFEALTIWLLFVSSQNQEIATCLISNFVSTSSETTLFVQSSNTYYYNFL